MKLIVTLEGSFSDEFDDGDLADLKEDLEDTCRIEYGGHGVSVEVVKA